jgi:DNA-binding transcriptional LysR family regulator
MEAFAKQEQGMRRLTDVDLRLIRIFRAIVECQGLAGAELVLNLSQSRISASLAELEARLGVRLCRRGRSGFALTEAGDTVYKASHDLFESVDRFCNQAGTVASKLKRVLRLGTVDALVTNRELSLPQAISHFRLHNPSVIIEAIRCSTCRIRRSRVTFCLITRLSRAAICTSSISSGSATMARLPRWRSWKPSSCWS